jgi:hypothetical protein
MANGDLQSLVVRRVNLTSQAATLSVLATFTDGTFGDGVMDIQRVGAYWYLYSLTGLRLRTANGYAVSIQDAATAEASHTVQEGLDRLGVSSVDPVVAQTFISQAQPNQPLIAALLSGKYNAFTFGHPVEGTGTITLPATITGPKNASADGHVTLVHKEIDGKDRTFLMTLALN